MSEWRTRLWTNSEAGSGGQMFGHFDRYAEIEFPLQVDRSLKVGGDKSIGRNHEVRPCHTGMIDPGDLALRNQLLKRRQPRSEPAAEIDGTGGRPRSRKYQRPNAAGALE